MISFLSGTIQSKQEKTIVLNVQGVGYLVHLPRNFLEKCVEGNICELYIHTHVREDELSLFGFASQAEWHFFQLLLKVSGVGPKSALEIINAPLPNLRYAIAKKDSAFLTRIPGIGNKTAERIIIDLQGKVKEELMEEDGAVTAREDIVQALISLGYHRHHVLEGLKKTPLELSDEESIIKYFLKHSS